MIKYDLLICLCLVIFNVVISQLIKNNKIESKYYKFILFINQLFIIKCILQTNNIKKIICIIYLYRLTFMVSIMPNICLNEIKILNLPFFNRTIAAIGELLYISIINKKYMKLIFLAEIMSYLGMFSKNTLFFFIENSIWTLCANIKILNSKNIITKINFLTICYILFMIRIDLPMYYNQYKIKKYGKPLNIIDGLNLSFKPMNIIPLNNKWNNELQWQILNFTMVPMHLLLLSQ